MRWHDIIKESLGHGVRYPEPRVGIELEFEGFGDNVYPELIYWTVVGDNSLRNGGVEFVSNPLLFEEVPPALAEVKAFIKMHDLQATARCGVHTHLNVGYWTWAELWCLSTMYLLLEPTIFKTFAPGRETNHFCVPFFADTVLAEWLATDAKKLRGNRLQHWDELCLLRCPKYTALNFAPLRPNGTVEFRQLLGTTDMADVQKWCDFLYKLQEKAKSNHDPNEVIAWYEDFGLEALCDELGLHTCEVDPLDQEDAEDSANLICGYEPLKWQDLNWEMKEAV